MKYKFHVNEYLEKDEYPDVFTMLVTLSEILSYGDAQSISELPEKVIRGLYQAAADVKEYGKYEIIGSGGLSDHAEKIVECLPILKKWEKDMCEFSPKRFVAEEFREEVTALINETLNALKVSAEYNVFCIDYYFSDTHSEVFSTVQIASEHGFIKESQKLLEAAKKWEAKDKSEKVSRCKAMAKGVLGMSPVEVLSNKNVIFHGVQTDIKKSHASLNLLWPSAPSLHYAEETRQIFKSEIEENIEIFKGKWLGEIAELRIGGVNSDASTIIHVLN